jgi:hypothetical protein
MDEIIDLREYMFKEIEIIQNIIKRMAFNSFIIKGWTITLITVTMLIKGGLNLSLVVLFPLFMFWYLDAWFLQQERAYRKLYDWTINNRLLTDANLLDMNASSRFKNDIEHIYQIMASKTLGIFYGTILLIILINNFNFHI